jgi:hypothetical protein
VSCLLIKCCKYFVFCSSTSAVFTAVLTINVINDSFNYTVTRHRWNCQELKYIIFVALMRLVARLFMFLLIFNDQRVPKITFVLVLTYYVKPHLFVIMTAIGWFIVNIQSDLCWHRCLGRQAFGTPRMYTLSPSKSIKGSNYGEFLKDKKCIVMYTTVQVRSEIGKFAYTAICMSNVNTLIIQGLTNPLARRPGLVISTFGLAEIISCMPDGLVKIYIGYWQTCQYSRIYLFSYMLYVV